MSTHTITIAILDAAAESLAALSDTVGNAGSEAVAALGAMVRAVPGSAVAGELPALPVAALASVLSTQCRQTARGIADGAQTYRAMDAALVTAATRAAGTAPVPR